MFAEHCPRHGARVLLPPSRIEAIHNHMPNHVVVIWRCWCGHLGRTDRRTPATHPTPATPTTPATPAGPSADPAPLSKAS